MGSSPLSRGIPPSNPGFIPGFGIIPALAGNTTPPGIASGKISDHPRSRGEYPYNYDAPIDAFGSSPLSRGILRRGPRRNLPRRIIPALAGNTRRRGRGICLSQDHPRSRGEYPRCEAGCATDGGSSPLSRGIPTPIPCLSGLGRIIPALAGNTPAASAKESPSKDHPRSRGEYAGLFAADGHVAGSSPLSRGIPRGQDPND